MALVSNGFKLAVTVVDNGANPMTKTYDLIAVDAAEAATHSATILLAYQAVTDAVVKSYHWYEEFVEDALVLPAAGVQVENQALISFTLVGDPTKTATHSIPAPIAAMFNAASGPGANIVNTANGFLATYAGLFITGANQRATISDGETAASLDKGQRIHRKSRRG